MLKQPVDVEVRFLFNMLKKLAVVLRGHKRTWDYVKHNQFNCFEQLAEVVDYYMVVWKVGNIEESILKKDFDNRNLKYLNLCPYKNDLTCSSQEYHINIALPKIFQEEYLSKEKYCAIIETRPDMAFNIIDPNIDPTNLINSLGVSGPTRYHVGSNENQKMLQDTCFIYNFYTGVLWNSRNIFDAELQQMFIDQMPNNSHNAYYEVAKYLNIKSYNIPWFNTVMVRPSIIYHNNNSNTLFENAHTALKQWEHQSTFAECLEACKLANINSCEYIDQIPRQPGVYKNKNS